MAVVVPFPVLRRQGYVHRQAMRMARETHRGAENWLAYILGVNRKAMLRKQIPLDLIAAELDGLERAIRTQHSCIFVRGDGAA